MNELKTNTIKATILSLSLACFPSRATAEENPALTDQIGKTPISEVSESDNINDLSNKIIESNKQITSIGNYPFTLEETVLLTDCMHKNPNFKLIICDLENSQKLSFAPELGIKQYVRDNYPEKFSISNNYIVLLHSRDNDSLFTATAYVDGSSNQATAPSVTCSNNFDDVIKSINAAAEAKVNNNSFNLTKFSIRSIINVLAFYGTYKLIKK